MKIEKIYKLVVVLFISSIPMMPIYTINVHYFLGFLCIILYFFEVLRRHKLSKFTYFEIAYFILIIYATIRVDATLASKNEDYTSYAYYMIKNMIFNFLTIVCSIQLLKITVEDMKSTVDIIGRTFIISTVIVSIYSIIYEYLILNDINRLGAHVFQGVYGERMTFTHNITVSFFFLIYKILTTIETNKIKPVRELIILIFLLIVSLLTGTRKLLLAPVLFTVFYVLIGKKITIRAAFQYGFIALILGAILFYFIMNVNFLYDLFGERIDSLIVEIMEGSGDSSSWQRKLMVEEGKKYFEDSPIFGIGTDGFRFKFREQTKTRIFKYSHNNFIELLADLGIIGATLYYGWMIYIIVKAMKQKKENLDLLFIGAVLTVIILDYWTVSYYRIQFLLVFALASLQLTNKLSEELKEKRKCKMGVKSTIQKIVGEENIRKIKGTFQYAKKVPFIMKYKKLKVYDERVENVKVYELEKKNVFCGYYDLNPVKDEKMLVHVAKRSDLPHLKEIEIGYFDLNTDTYNKITTTKAWCWQQGSRLQWSEKEKNIIYFNDVEDNHYCFRKYDIEKKKLIETIPFPVYDINKEETFGISLNFSRLQRLRPGYGYSIIEDKTEKEKAPLEDGIFYVDIKNKKIKLLVSLDELSKNVDPDKKYEHYVNHISISPDSKKVMFFHLWTEKEWSGWRTELCVMNIDGTNLEILEQKDIVSHYNWKDDNTILITGVKYKTKENFYRHYYIKQKSKEDIEDENLKRDGHPTYEHTKEIFYSDTYPNENFIQSVFAYNFLKKQYTKLVDVFSDPRLVYEKRCDLHPKIVDKNRILIDTTYKKYKRSVILINLEGR